MFSIIGGTSGMVMVVMPSFLYLKLYKNVEDCWLKVGAWFIIAFGGIISLTFFI